MWDKIFFSNKLFRKNYLEKIYVYNIENGRNNKRTKINI